MKGLLIGEGGREDAIAQELVKSPEMSELVAAPGNPGIAQKARCEPVDLRDPQDIARLARDERADLVVVGPEVPLVAGAIDAIMAEGIAGFGPSAAAARLEGSKVFMKDLVREAGVRTARYGVFNAGEEARAMDFMRRFPEPPVLKADGLAAGKGVLVGDTYEEVEAGIREYLSGRAFGNAGKTILLEERLAGTETSLLVLCDGTQAIPLEAARDYKRLRDGDQGPNTGGMGSFSPVPGVSPELVDQAMAEAVEPTLAELRRQGIEFRGILYAGLMLTEQGMYVLEFNVRFGDPETQAVLPRLQSDLATHCYEAATGELKTPIEWHDQAAVTVVLAAPGYPENPQPGGVITGIEAAHQVEGISITHAGTQMREGELYATGGRVLGVTGIGPELSDARATAYEAADKISWPGLQRREDIGENTSDSQLI